MTGSRSTRVLVVDDQELVRRGFCALIAAVDGLEVVGEAATGSEAIDQALATRPDVIMMDIRMPDLDGIAATQRITGDERLAGTRVLVLTTFDLDQYVYDALRAGASGFLLEDTAPQQLLDAIRVVAAGDALIAPGITRRLISEFAARPDVVGDSIVLADLTSRERDVLIEVGGGRNNAEIAERLLISPLTAKTHVSRIMTKLSARDRAQLAVIAYETGLVTPGDAPPDQGTTGSSAVSHPDARVRARLSRAATSSGSMSGSLASTDPIVPPTSAAAKSGEVSIRRRA
jgi:DNA-binding NarL/FixJ family response regulator